MNERNFIKQVPFPATPFKIDCGDLPEVREWLSSNGYRFGKGEDLTAEYLGEKYLVIRYGKPKTVTLGASNAEFITNPRKYFDLLAEAESAMIAEGELVQLKAGAGFASLPIEKEKIDQQSIVNSRHAGQEYLEKNHIELDNYQRLQSVLDSAYDQAVNGKGKERHAQGLPFEDQPMLSISRMLSSNTGLAYQAIKKIQESQRMDTDAAIRELYGAIIYVAGMIIFLEGEVTNVPKSNHD